MTMNTTQRTTVVGVFDNSRDAQRAVEELRRAGFREDQIGVASHEREQTHPEKGTTTEETHAGTGAVTGALAGAGLGAAWGIAAVAGLIPAIGPVIAGGTLAAVLASAGLGAAAVGIAGALIGMGIPEEEAHYYESEFKAGRTIVSVKCEGRTDEALAILRRHNAYDATTRHAAGTTCASHVTARPAAPAISTGHTVGASVPPAAPAHTAPTAAARSAQTGDAVRLHEEQLRVQKQPVQTGEVKVRKEVHTEHQTVDVPIKKEEVVIERRPVSGPASTADIHAGEEIRIPVKEEQVKVEKQAVVKEEVKIGKRQVQDTERVSGDVRKEEVRIEKAGDVDVNTRRTTDEKRK